MDEEPEVWEDDLSDSDDEWAGELSIEAESDENFEPDGMDIGYLGSMSEEIAEKRWKRQRRRTRHPILTHHGRFDTNGEN